MASTTMTTVHAASSLSESMDPTGAEHDFRFPRRPDLTDTTAMAAIGDDSQIAAIAARGLDLDAQLVSPPSLATSCCSSSSGGLVSDGGASISANSHPNSSTRRSAGPLASAGAVAATKSRGTRRPPLQQDSNLVANQLVTGDMGDIGDTGNAGSASSLGRDINRLMQLADFPPFLHPRGGLVSLSPQQMQAEDPLSKEIWQFYSSTKLALPAKQRMENLIWRMMYSRLPVRRASGSPCEGTGGQRGESKYVIVSSLFVPWAMSTHQTENRRLT